MARVSSIFIYPDRDQPGQTLETSYVSREGLDGDRRKKSPVHLVAVENYIDFHPRANLVVDIAGDDLHALVGRRLRIGSVELVVTALAVFRLARHFEAKSVGPVTAAQAVAGAGPEPLPARDRVAPAPLLEGSNKD